MLPGTIKPPSILCFPGHLPMVYGNIKLIQKLKIPILQKWATSFSGFPKLLDMIMIFRTSNGKLVEPIPCVVAVAKEHILQGGACCVWALARAISLMDEQDFFLGLQEAAELKNLLLQHLLHWQGRHQQCLVQGVMRWKLRPKHHMAEELAFRAYRTQINPRFLQCFQDESYLGQFKNIAVRCHETSVLSRALERLVLLLSQRWKERREHSQQSGQS